MTFHGPFGYARAENEEKKGLYTYIIQEQVMGESVVNDTRTYPDIFVNPWRALPELQDIRDLTSNNQQLFLLNEKGQVFSLGNGQFHKVSP